MARSAGIELGEDAVRLLALEVQGRRTRILKAHEAPIEADAERPWEERAAEALRKALADSGIPRGRAVGSVDSAEAILREVSLPFKSDDQIRKTVRFEIESQIHNFTIEQLIVSHYKTDESEKGALLLAAAVPKTALERRLKAYQRAGVDPMALDLDVAAIFNAMKHAGAIESQTPHLLVHGASKFTKLVFVEGGRPRSIRTIHFSLPAGKAEPNSGRSAPAPEGGRGEGGEAMVVLDEEQSRRFADLGRDVQDALVGILAREISRFLLAQAATANPSHMLLSGGFEDEEARRRIEEAAQIPARTFNPLEAIDPSAPAEVRARSSKFAAALGLALKGAGVDALGMDFRQEEFLYRRKYEALKTTALVTLELVIVLLAAVGLHFHFRRSDYGRDLATVRERQRELCELVTGETLRDALEAYPKLKEMFLRVDTSAVDLPIRVSAREAWRHLFGALASFQQKYGQQTLGDGPLYLELESLDIQQSTNPGNESLTLTLSGKVRNLQFADVLRAEIRSVELFRSADWVGGLAQTEGGMYKFTLRATKRG
jgi:Tfp pilus assembly PilM family ATPase